MLLQCKLNKLFLAVFSAFCAENANATIINNNQEITINSTWTDTGTNVGYETDGHLIVTDGGVVTTNLLKIARGGSQGIVDVINGGKINVVTTGGILEVGGSTSSPNTTNTSVGILNISGPGSLVYYESSTSPMKVGVRNSQGFIYITDGGKLYNSDTEPTSQGLWLGADVIVPGETSGTVVVDGVGSELWTGARLIVGAYGAGSLMTLNGGVTRVDDKIQIGSQPGTLAYDNVLTVSGADSRISAGTFLAVGVSGRGTAVASDEGTLSAPEIQIANNAGSLGELASGSRADDDAAAAGTIDAQRIIFGAGKGVLTLNHTSSDFLLSANISGNGEVNALSGVSVLSGDNSAYQGNFTVDAPATLIISEQKNIGTNDIVMTSGTLEINTAQDWQFINTLKGQGTLAVSAGGNTFEFSSSSLTDNFSGNLVLKDSLFSLADTNTAALGRMMLTLGSGSVAKVGDGQQSIDGLSFDGGMLVLGEISPGQTTTENTVHATGMLDISGQGTVQISTGRGVSNDQPTPDTHVPLMAQDEGELLVQLASGEVVAGSGGNLTLTDQNGSIISDGGTTIDITRNGSVAAHGTYDYRLTGGDNSDGLYVSYGLTQVALLGQGNNALVLASEGRTGSSADLSARLTGSGDLAIDTGEGNTLSLSNLDNDYTGITDIRSGSLLMLNDSVLGSSSLLQMAQGTGLEMNGHHQTMDRVDIAEGAQVNIDGGSLGINQGGQIAGELNGSGSLILNDGALNVEGENSSLSADITVAQNATANLKAAQGLGTGSMDLAGQVNLTTADGLLMNSLSNNGTLALHSSRVQLAGDNSSFSGVFMVDADSNLIASEAAHLGDASVENAGQLTLSTDENWLLGNRVNGTGNVLKDGTGTVALGTDSTLYTGTTDILLGGLTFGAGDNSATLASSQVNIHDAGALAGNGVIAGSVNNRGLLQVGTSVTETLSQAAAMDKLTINGNLTNGGLVQIARMSGAAQPGNRLVVNGDYTGDGGRLVFRSMLNDDASLTDHMSVAGDTTGTTRISVTRAGGAGAQTLEGIELINVGGRSDGSFIQDGRIVAGAYDYSLVRGKGAAQGNWYLSSMTETGIPGEPGSPEEPEPPGSPAGESQLRPEMGSYLANSQAANTLFMTHLHDRSGEMRYTDALTGEKKVTSIWMRSVGGHIRFKDGSGQIRTQGNRYVLQIGGDLAQWSTDYRDRWHLGVMGGYASSRSRSESNVTGYTSRGQVNGYSAGLYGTWYANDTDKAGTYVDTWALYNWFDNTVNGQGQATEKYRSGGMTASLEAGYSLKVAENKRDSYWLQPKAQAVWMDVQAEDHQEQNGTRVKEDSSGNLMTRLGLKGYINRHNAMDDDNTRTFQPFVEMNWIHSTHNASVTMNGVRNEMRGAKNAGELKVGMEGQLTSQLNLWGNVAQQVGDKGYSDTQGVLGIKYVW